MRPFRPTFEAPGHRRCDGLGHGYTRRKDTLHEWRGMGSGGQRNTSDCVASLSKLEVGAVVFDRPSGFMDLGMRVSRAHKCRRRRVVRP